MDKTNLTPSFFNARIMKGKLIQTINIPRGLDVKVFKIMEIPVMPPSIMWLGAKKPSIAKA